MSFEFNSEWLWTIIDGAHIRSNSFSLALPPQNYVFTLEVFAMRALLSCLDSEWRYINLETRYDKLTVRPRTTKACKRTFGQRTVRQGLITDDWSTNDWSKDDWSTNDWSSGLFAKRTVGQIWHFNVRYWRRFKMMQVLLLVQTTTLSTISIIPRPPHSFHIRPRESKSCCWSDTTTTLSAYTRSVHGSEIGLHVSVYVSVRCFANRTF